MNVRHPKPSHNLIDAQDKELPRQREKKRYCRNRAEGNTFMARRYNPTEGRCYRKCNKQPDARLLSSLTCLYWWRHTFDCRDSASLCLQWADTNARTRRSHWVNIDNTRGQSSCTLCYPYCWTNHPRWYSNKGTRGRTCILLSFITQAHWREYLEKYNLLLTLNL